MLGEVGLDELNPGIQRSGPVQLGLAEVEAHPLLVGKLGQVPALSAAGVQPVSQRLQQSAERRGVELELGRPVGMLDEERGVVLGVVLAVNLGGRVGVPLLIFSGYLWLHRQVVPPNLAIKRTTARLWRRIP